ncbi:MAG: prenylated flavin chaperone LpdD [Halobacteriota archaeon]
MPHERLVLRKRSGPVELELEAAAIGRDLLVLITGGESHLGAVAVGGFAIRSYVSVITMPGHKDDCVAKEAASRIADHLKRACAVLVGIHLVDPSKEEISSVVKDALALVDRMIEALK